MPIIDIDLSPDRRKLRPFGFVALVAFGLLGGLVLWRGGLFGIDFGGAARTVAYVLFGVGVASALCSLVRPELNRGLYVAIFLLTFPIGFVLSYVILGFVFFLVISPVGIFFRIVGRDRLRLRRGRAEETYWVRRPAEPGRPARYFRQY